jgi:hypothetical protein
MHLVWLVYCGAGPNQEQPVLLSVGASLVSVVTVSCHSLTVCHLAKMPQSFFLIHATAQLAMLCISSRQSQQEYVVWQLGISNDLRTGSGGWTLQWLCAFGAQPVVN